MTNQVAVLITTNRHPKPSPWPQSDCGELITMAVLSTSGGDCPGRPLSPRTQTTHGRSFFGTPPIAKRQVGFSEYRVNPPAARRSGWGTRSQPCLRPVQAPTPINRSFALRALWCYMAKPARPIYGRLGRVRSHESTRADSQDLTKPGLGTFSTHGLCAVIS